MQIDTVEIIISCRQCYFQKKAKERQERRLIRQMEHAKRFERRKQ